MPQLYPYCGPPELCQPRPDLPARTLIESSADVYTWIAQQLQIPYRYQITATFIIALQAQLWIANQHSEHVDCARGASVLAAGEITFIGIQGNLIWCELTNQSTGYCPKPEAWEVVQQVLNRIGLPHGNNWTACYEFRRCLACTTINLIKEQWFFCSFCDQPLSLIWNIAPVGA